MPGVLNINIFYENRHDAFFYIKEKTLKNKFEIGVLKTRFWTPEKKVFVSKFINALFGGSTNFYFFSLCLSIKNSRCTNVVLVNTMHYTKLIIAKNGQNGDFDS